MSRSGDGPSIDEPSREPAGLPEAAVFGTVGHRAAAIDARQFIRIVVEGEERDWENLEIRGEVVLRSGIVNRPVNVRGAIFTDTVDCDGCRFERGVNLSGCQFRSGLVFSNARIEGPLLLDRATIVAESQPGPNPDFIGASSPA